MKLIVSILFAIFALSGQGYISDNTYYFAGDLSAGSVTLGGNTGSPPRGSFLLTFDPPSSKLHFQIASNLPLVGDVGLFGPTCCYDYKNSKMFPQDSAECIYNTAPLLKKLATGRAMKADDKNPDLTSQVFNGAVTLNNKEIEMLFDSELYIEMNTLISSLDGKSFVNKPFLRGTVSPWAPGNDMKFYFSFGANTGEFGKNKITKTTNSAVGYISFNPAGTTYSYKFFHNLANPGTLLLNCTGAGILNLGVQNKDTPATNNPITSPLPTEPDQSAILPAILSELTVNRHCYLVLTSAEFPSGELFAWPTQPTLFQSVLTGKEAGVVSAYFASTMINFDYGTKTLAIQTKTNITLATVTSFQVVAKNGTLICDLAPTTGTLPSLSYCRLNSTWIPELEKKNINLKISTTANPNGELLGIIDYNSGVGSPSDALSTGAKVGIAFGVIGGVLLIVAIIVGVVFLKKKSNSKI